MLFFSWSTSSSSSSGGRVRARRENSFDVAIKGGRVGVCGRKGGDAG